MQLQGYRYTPAPTHPRSFGWGRGAGEEEAIMKQYGVKTLIIRYLSPLIVEHLQNSLTKHD